MKNLITTLALLLCSALPTYADTLSVQVNRDNGAGTEITDSIVLNAANIGAVKAADFKVKNLLSSPYNIKNDGTDQGAAINAILAAAVDGDVFYLPAGTYGHSIPIVLPDKMIKIYGDGPHATFFKALGTMTNGIYRAASSSVVYRCELSNFGILGEKKVSYGVRIEAWKQAKLNRLYIEDVLTEGLTLGQNGTSGSTNMFYEAQISEIEVYQKTGAWLPDPTQRVDKGVHLLNSASDNDITNVVVAHAETCGIHDEAYGNNRYSHIHPWDTPYGMIVGGSVSISQGEFDTNTTAGVKIASNWGNVSITASQFAFTPTGVEIADNTPNVTIMGNVYDANATNAYIINGTATKGTNFTFVDKGAAVIPGLVSNTTGTAAGLSANIAESQVTNLVTDLSAKPTATLVTSVGSPGLDTNVATEKAVRTAIAAAASSPITLKTNGSNNGSQSTLNLSAGTGVTLADNGSGTVTVTSTGSMVYPGAGVPNSTGTAWGTSYTVGTGASNLVQLNGSSQLPAVSGALLTNLPSQIATSTVTVNPTSTSSVDGTTVTRATPDLSVSGTYTTLNMGHTYTTNAPNASTQVRHFLVAPNYSGTGTLPTLIGVYSTPRNTGTGTISTLEGYNSWLRNTSTGTVNFEMIDYNADSPTNAGTIASGTVVAGVRIKNHGLTGPTNTYGIKIDDQSGSANSWALYTGAGKVLFGDDVQVKTLTGTIPAATTYASTTTIDLSLGDSPSVTLTGNPTLAFSNPKAGQWHRLNIVQDGTGSRTVTWPSTGLVCSWRNTSGHTAPTLLTAAGAVDTIVIHTLSTTSAECWTTGNL